MKFKRNLLKVFTGFTVLSIQVLFSSCDSELEIVQSINEEFSGINKVEIESGFLEVIYQGDPSMTTIQLDAVLESNRSGRYQIEYREDQDKLIIELDQKNIGSSGRSRGHIYLRGPVEMELDVEVGSGKATISNVIGDLMEISAGSGKLIVQDLNANKIDLRAGSGDLSLINLEGNTKIEIGSGSVTMRNILGNVSLNGSSGSYKAENVEGMLHAKLNSGNMDLIGINEIGKLEVSSGRINAINSGLSSESKFNASSGNIRIQTFSDLNGFNFSLSAGSGKVSVGDSSSSGNLNIDNGSPYTVSGVVSSGNIEIRN
ncbi:DUF4097 family beta strand repeat-containing protein [Algoriphagus sp.]|uniref:DUF4097 family beta strand repeat-containing protein n=1 Tax=Algoriphagus sp. TaxID=1872435 RepID=UPI0025EBBAFC|nr:DUF4097 family beta strand repeat-containing protein [Algoriphagus sp.]